MTTWYQQWNGIVPRKVCLLRFFNLDNAPGHPSNLSNMHPYVKVVYLPLNTMSLIQLMDQGVIANFKAYYHRRTIRSALSAIEGNKELTLKQFWKGCIITDASAWEGVKTTTLCTVLKDLTRQKMSRQMRKILGLSKRLKLDLEDEDVTELLTCHGEGLSSEDLIELEQQMIEEDLEVPDPKPRALTIKGLSESFTHLERALVSFQGEDPNIGRFDRILRWILNLKKKPNPDPPGPEPSVAAIQLPVEPFDSDDDPDDPEPIYQTHKHLQIPLHNPVILIYTYQMPIPVSNANH
ncbi:tigger transposable element-derived protein 1-like [Macrobrachium nipponense]|uniref:tigger transposable element-derived protein 1-like n=1 Tax=Macrobrachium nipponense TaxID=159736 RepID=UPI0030C8830D